MGLEGQALSKGAQGSTNHVWESLERAQTEHRVHRWLLERDVVHQCLKGPNCAQQLSVLTTWQISRLSLLPELASA